MDKGVNIYRTVKGPYHEAMAMKHELLFLAMLLLVMVSPGSCGRSAVCGGDGEVRRPAFDAFKEWALSYSCNQTYVFMPCIAAATVPGNIVLTMVYVSLMMFAAKLLYDGSAILVELLTPAGIAGGVFLPLLSSLLDAAINIASRQCGGKEAAQNQVSAGIGLLTGSTAILLILLGGSCIIVDKCDLGNSRDEASEDAARGFSLTGSAVSTDIRASYTARIMVISVMPFIILQLAQVLHTSSKICLSIFVSLVLSVSLLLAHCHYQVFHPSMLRRTVTYAKQRHTASRIVEQLKHGQLGRLLTTNDEPDIEVIRMIFQIKDKDLAIDDAVGDVMRDSDACGDSNITVEASAKGTSEWLNHEAKNSAVCSSNNDLKTRLPVEDFTLVSNKENELLDMQNDEVVKIENPKWSASKAVLMLVLGSLMASIFAVPLVNAVGNFSTATTIPSFFVSLVVLPCASFSEAVSAQMFASQNNLRIASFRFSEIYGAVTMNNFLCMSVFLGLLYFRQLRWNFTCEVLIVLIIWSFLPREYG